MSAEDSHLVPLNFALGIIVKVSISLVAPFHDLVELVSKCGVEEVMHAQARARRFRGICGAYAFLGRTDAVKSSTLLAEDGDDEGMRRTRIPPALPLSAHRRSGESQIRG